MSNNQSGSMSPAQYKIDWKVTMPIKKITISDDGITFRVDHDGINIYTLLGMLNCALFQVETQLKIANIKAMNERDKNKSISLDEAADQLATLTQNFLDRLPASERKKRLKAFKTIIRKMRGPSK